MLQIESAVLSVSILPEIGGKIGQIQSKATGRRLLVSPRRSYVPIPLDGDWLKGDTSGMDDCFPNVAAGTYPCAPWDNVQLRDLGEWTHGSWTVTQAAADGVVLERPGIALPYFVRKAVRFANERTLEFSYRVENRGGAALRYLWSAHPLIDVPDEYELRLPPGALAFRTFPGDGQLRAWPGFDATDLSRQWIPRGSDLKIFITGLSEGWCEVRLPHQSLRFEFDLGTTPVLGVWFNNFGFPASGAAPFRCIGVEPCTSPSDTLDELPASAYPAIPAGGVAEWAFRLAIDD